MLIRARAIENGCFVFASAQGGHHENGRDTFGHALVVDPWGRVLAEGGTEPGVVLAKIDPAEVVAARARVPSLQHGRRFEIAPRPSPRRCTWSGASMIRYALACAKEHSFESWFQNSAAYDKQVKRGLVTCPLCGDAKVEKAIMAPRSRAPEKRGRAGAGAGRDAAVGRAPPAESKTPVAMVSPQEREFRAKLKELREHLTKNSDYVGRNFPKKPARCTTARSTTVRSTAKPRPMRPRSCTRKASSFIRCRCCRTSATRLRCDPESR